MNQVPSSLLLFYKYQALTFNLFLIDVRFRLKFFIHHRCVTYLVHSVRFILIYLPGSKNILTRR